MESRTLDVTTPSLDADNLGFFRWGSVGDKVVATNDAGEWSLLTPSEFDELLAGKVAKDHPRFEEFQTRGFVRDGLDLDALATKIAERNRHVRRGPYLHIVTLKDRNGLEMNRETAEKTAEFALQGTSPAMTFDLRSDDGEPLRNFATLQSFVESAKARNRDTTGKELRFFVLTNLSAMTEEIAEFLIANEVRVVAALDGPAALHDANRESTGAASHADVVRWIDYFTRRYTELERDAGEWHVAARPTVTKQSLAALPSVVDEYITRGIRTIHIVPLDRFRFESEAWGKIGYSDADFLRGSAQALDYILEKNLSGSDIADGLAASLLAKILTTEDLGVVDLQSPNGAGGSQIAYAPDGLTFPCEEARFLSAARQDPTFALGPVGELSVSEIANHPSVRAISAASLLDSHPFYGSRWNKPYCGLNPVRNYLAQGDLFGQHRYSVESKLLDALCTQLFEILATDTDAGTKDILQRWSSHRPPCVTDRRVFV